MMMTRSGPQAPKRRPPLPLATICARAQQHVSCPRTSLIFSGRTMSVLLSECPLHTELAQQRKTAAQSLRKRRAPCLSASI